MAGSGIRGQFEEKFKALIRDIEEEVRYHSISSVAAFYLTS
jgi:ATP-dependent Clp protease ATP-binding subunit ClpA